MPAHLHYITEFVYHAVTIAAIWQGYTNAIEIRRGNQVQLLELEVVENFFVSIVMFSFPDFVYPSQNNVWTMNMNRVLTMGSGRLTYPETDNATLKVCIVNL